MSDVTEQSSGPRRWDEPFGSEMTDEVVQELLAAAPFSGIDASRFPRHLQLGDILLNDTRVLTLARDQIIVREGDYGNSAFLVLQGTACVFLESLPRSLLGRGVGQKKSLLRTIAQVWRATAIPERRVHHTRRHADDATRRSDDEDAPSIFLQDVPVIVKDRRTEKMHPGDIFGEIAALGRSPRTATVIAAEDGTRVLEIRWQALRDLMQFAPEIREYIEGRFRKFGLRSHLEALDMIKRLPRPAVQEIVEATRFERHGRLDWYGTYQQLLDAETPAERLRNEPLILTEGDYLNGVIIVRGGFVRVSRRHYHGEETISYLGKGQTYGLNEILQHFQNPAEKIVSRHSLRAVGYVDILLIPTALVEKLIIPHLTPAEVRRFAPAPRKSGKEDAEPMKVADDTRAKLGPGIMDFFMDKRTLNGRAAMLIDLDRCTACDDCVRACASTHDGNPRFVRHGDQREGIQITQACMHCQDPICMIPCPTGAIHREESGEVVINDSTCIGCSSCANNCPYNNIQMVGVRDENGRPQFPVKLDGEGNIVRDGNGEMISLTAEGVVRRATKCDLCFEHLGGPACVRACPHDALIRVDMQNIDKLADWLSR